MEQRDFGQLEDGTSIELYTLTNSKGLSAEICTYGATLVSLIVPDREGKLEDVVLGFDELAGYRSETYLKESPYFGATIGRYANRIAKGHFSLEGQSYQLAVNDPPNHLHGGLRGFDKVVWKAAAFRSENEVGVVLQYVSPEGEEGYPGALHIQLTYSLSEDDALTLQYKAHTDAATVLNLTNHAYFNLKPSPMGSILAHEVMIDADAFLPIDNTQIPTGKQKEVKGTPFDFRTPTPLGQRIDESEEQIKQGKGYDHCFVLNQRAEATSPAATVYEPKSGRFMEVFTTEPGLQLYTGNLLNNKLKGKGGVSYGKHFGLCLETQHFPDSPNQPQFPSTVLRPGETFQTNTAYRFSSR